MFMIANSLVDLNLNQTLRTPELLSDAVRLGRGLRKTFPEVEYDNVGHLISSTGTDGNTLLNAAMIRIFL